MILRLTALIASIFLTACSSMDIAAPSTAAPQLIARPVAQSDPPFPLPPAVKAPSISVARLKAWTRTLSSDAFEGRAPTTPSEEKTIAYLIKQMAAVGLQPGNEGSWTQDVPLVELTASDDMVLNIRGGNQPLDLQYKSDMVSVSYHVQPRIDLTKSEMVFVGYGITAPEKNWDDYAGLDVHGKTVVILVNDPDYEMATLDGPFDGRAMTYYGRWTYKYEEAARHGAAAALIIHDTFPAAYPWGVVVSSWVGPQLQLDLPGGHMDATLVNGWVTLDAAKSIFASAGKDFGALTAAAKRPGFRPVPLGLTASLGFDNAIRRQASKNIIGLLPGNSRPDEYVLYSAHWDHLGYCEPVDGDGICNGAVDNASGIAGLLALARANAQLGPAARSMIFLAVTAEESGLLGSAYYSENPIFPLSQTAGGVNLDGLNVTGPTHDVTIIGGGKSQLELLLARAVHDQGRVLEPEGSPEKGSFYRSDHFSFAKRGVPVVYAESGEDKLEGGVAAGLAAAADYTDRRYHKPQDEYDPGWNWDGAVLDLQIYFRVGRELADSAAWPSWYPSAEFHEIRKKSRNLMD